MRQCSKADMTSVEQRTPERRGGKEASETRDHQATKQRRKEATSRLSMPGVISTVPGRRKAKQKMV